MVIGIGSDQWGRVLKDHLVRYFRHQGLEIRDLGAHTPDPVDYPEIAGDLAKAIKDGDITNGVLICRTGLGMAIAANKVKGIFAATVHNLATARAAAASNDVHIITMGADYIGFTCAKQYVSAWLATPFKGGDSARKVGKIREMDTEFAPPVAQGVGA